MHQIQEKLLDLSKEQDLHELSLRAMAEAIGYEGHSPQKIKHHLQQLEKKGYLNIQTVRTDSANELDLLSIPIYGSANCGPASIFAEQNLQGALRVTSKLIGRTKPDGLYCIRASGDSMNRTDIRGKNIEDGDYIIVDCLDKYVRTGDIVLAVIDNMATVKRFIKDDKNNQVVLMPESTSEYPPIFLHEDDNFTLNAKVIDVVKEPRL